MRGKAIKSIFSDHGNRITPAYAGKSLLHLTFHNRHEDHPRLCGEKLLISALRIQRAGSPPPMRGKVLDAGGFRKAVRITPAYAGKSTMPV